MKYFIKGPSTTTKVSIIFLVRPRTVISGHRLTTSPFLGDNISTKIWSFQNLYESKSFETWFDWAAHDWNPAKHVACNGIDSSMMCQWWSVLLFPVEPLKKASPKFFKQLQRKSLYGIWIQFSSAFFTHNVVTCLLWEHVKEVEHDRSCCNKAGRFHTQGSWPQDPDPSAV